MRKISIPPNSQLYLLCLAVLATAGIVGGAYALGVHWREEAAALQTRAERERAVLALYEERAAARRPRKNQDVIAPEEFHVQLLGREDFAEGKAGSEYLLLGRYTDLVELLAAWEGGPPLRQIEIVSMTGQSGDTCLLRMRVSDSAETVPQTEDAQ